MLVLVSTSLAWCLCDGCFRKSLLNLSPWCFAELRERQTSRCCSSLRLVSMERDPSPTPSSSLPPAPLSSAPPPPPLEEDSPESVAARAALEAHLAGYTLMLRRHKRGRKGNREEHRSILDLDFAVSLLVRMISTHLCWIPYLTIVDFFRVDGSFSASSLPP